MFLRIDQSDDYISDGLRLGADSIVALIECIGHNLQICCKTLSPAKADTYFEKKGKLTN